jgi:hypothetical protein
MSELKDCNKCDERWSCVVACPEVNAILASIDIQLCEEEGR